MRRIKDASGCNECTPSISTSRLRFAYSHLQIAVAYRKRTGTRRFEATPFARLHGAKTIETISSGDDRAGSIGDPLSRP